MASAVGQASASLRLASVASIAAKGRKVALSRFAKPVPTRSSRRGVVVKAATELTTEVQTIAVDEGRDEDWNITYFPGMVNIESMIEEIYTDGFNEAICLYAPGGVAEQMLLLPLIESIYTRLPNVAIDVVCGERAHSAYDICPYVRSTFTYNVGGFALPDTFAEMVGTLKGEYYKTIISAAPANVGEQFLLWMASSTNVIGTTERGSGGLTSRLFFAASENAAADEVGELGTSTFVSLEELVGEQLGGSYDTSRLPNVGVPAKAQEWAAGALQEAGLSAGGFVLAHGVPSKSAAAMTMAAYPASTSMDVAALEGVSKPVVVAVPKAEDKAAVESATSGATVLVVDTPAKLAALVAASGGVVAANTAALPMASYFKKPAVGIFESASVAALYEYTGATCVAASAASSAVAAM